MECIKAIPIQSPTINQHATNFSGVQTLSTSYVMLALCVGWYFASYTHRKSKVVNR
jgi:hypothetical protein